MTSEMGERRSGEARRPRRWLPVIAAVVVFVSACVGKSDSDPQFDLAGSWFLVELASEGVPEGWVPSLERWEFEVDGSFTVVTPVNDGQGFYIVDGSTTYFRDVTISGADTPDPVDHAIDAAMKRFILTDSVVVTVVNSDRIVLEVGDSSATLERRSPVTPP